jgi:hypothetical protein
MGSIGEFQPFLPIFGGRRFVTESENLSYNDLLQKFRNSIPKEPTYEEKVEGQKILTHLKNIDQKANKDLQNKSWFQRLTTLVRQFFGNRNFDRSKVIKDMEELFKIKKEDKTKHNQKHFPIMNVDDAYEQIFKYCDPQTIVNLSSTCKGIRERSKNYKRLQTNIENLRSMYSEMKIFNPRLIEALGGVKAVFDLPSFTPTFARTKNDPLSLDTFTHLKSPLIRGVDKSGNSFIAICYTFTELNDHDVIVADSKGNCEKERNFSTYENKKMELLYYHKKGDIYITKYNNGTEVLLDNQITPFRIKELDSLKTENSKWETYDEMKTRVVYQRLQKLLNRETISPQRVVTAPREIIRDFKQLGVRLWESSNPNPNKSSPDRLTPLPQSLETT